MSCLPAATAYHQQGQFKEALLMYMSSCELHDAPEDHSRRHGNLAVLNLAALSLIFSCKQSWLSGISCFQNSPLKHGAFIFFNIAVEDAGCDLLLWASARYQGHC